MPDTNEIRIPKRILTSLLSSVSAGVVPRAGAPYIAIGREDEIKTLASDLDAVAEGGAGMRFIVGKYGSGKSFLIQLMRGFALDRNFITADGDLSPERRLCGTKGAGRATFRELMKNLASKSSPDGGALPSVLSKWMSSLQASVAAGGILPTDSAFDRAVETKLFEVISTLRAQIGGFDFANVLMQYYRASRDGNEEKKAMCLRWLRGEYPTKSEAKAQLGVFAIIDDESWYDYIKLYAVFFRSAGYAGFVVFIDECVNLYKIANRISRENNYEKILAMFNDTLQCKAEGLELILGGTPQFLEDSRRGIYSYEALRSRLYDGRFASPEYKNLIGPVIRLRRLSDEELYALILRLARLHGQCYSWVPRITPQECEQFLGICLKRAGADTLITPREIIRDFISVLNILMQNPDATASSLFSSGAVTLSRGGAGDGDDEAAGGAQSGAYDKTKYDFNPEDIDI